MLVAKVWIFRYELQRCGKTNWWTDTALKFQADTQKLLEIGRNDLVRSIVFSIYVYLCIIYPCSRFVLFVESYGLAHCFCCSRLLTQPQRSWVFIPTSFGLAITKLVNWKFQDRHHPQCRAFHASQVGVKPLTRWRIASSRPWSDVSPASQHAFLEMDQSHRWWMIQHRFPVTFTKAFYVPRSKPKVRSRGSIFPIADKMETLCCTSPK